MARCPNVSCGPNSHFRAAQQVDVRQRVDFTADIAASATNTYRVQGVTSDASSAQALLYLHLQCGANGAKAAYNVLFQVGSAPTPSSNVAAQTTFWDGIGAFRIYFALVAFLDLCISFSNAFYGLCLVVFRAVKLCELVSQSTEIFRGFFRCSRFLDSALFIGFLFLDLLSDLV